MRFRISNFELRIWESPKAGLSRHGMLGSGRLLTTGRVERPLKKSGRLK